MKVALHVLCMLLVISTASSDHGKGNTNSSGNDKKSSKSEDNKKEKCKWLEPPDGLDYNKTPWRKVFLFHDTYIESSTSVDSLDVIPYTQTIVGDCTATTNKCPTGVCILGFKDDSTSKKGSQGDCLEYGVVKPATVDDEVDCGAFRKRKIKRITCCVCMKVTTIDVNVIVKKCNSEIPIPDFLIHVDGEFSGKTDTDGILTTSVSAKPGRVVIHAQSDSISYLPSTKVIEISIGAYALQPISICVLALATPISFHSSEEKKLSISNNPSASDTGVGNIIIAKNSFWDKNGSPFNGILNVHFNYIDVADLYLNDAVITGRFLTNTNRGTEPLISAGLFALTFTDESNNSLQVDPDKPLTVQIGPGLKLWYVNTQTGLWEDLKARRLDGQAGPRGRGKRQVNLVDLELKLTNFTWVNIDKIPGSPECYFKARVFKQNRVTEIEQSDTTSFVSGAVGYILDDGQRLRFYLPSTKSPASFCNTIRCPDGENSMIGLINMTSTDNFLVGGLTIPSRMFLEPKQIGEYSQAIQEYHQSINYTISSNGKNIIVSFTSNVTGPFYEDEESCESSEIEDAAFHFVIGTPPNYEPYPVKTKLCTARVALVIHVNEITTVLDLTPTSIIVVSLWEENSIGYFFTDNTEIDMSTLTAINTNVTVCIRYRCSEDDSQTLVYIIVVPPNITQPVNATHNVTVPAIDCRGKCDGDQCYGDVPNGIDGALTPPTLTDDTNEPRYYSKKPKKCEKEDDREQFAVVLYCRGQNPGEV